MRIILSPIATEIDDTPPVISGLNVQYRSQLFALNQIAEGQRVTFGDPVVLIAECVGGKLSCEVVYRYNQATAEHSQPVERSHYTFEITEGQCQCPIIRKAPDLGGQNEQ